MFPQLPALKKGKDFCSAFSIYCTHLETPFGKLQEDFILFGNNGHPADIFPVQYLRMISYFEMYDK